MTDLERAIIAAAEAHIGDPYVYGAWGGLCTPAYRRQYLGYNPSHTAIQKNCPVLSGKATSCDGCKYQGRRAYDCRGFLRWIFEQIGITISGGGATSQYNAAKNWMLRGEICEMPDRVCAVFQRKAGSTTMLHTGVHIGGGQIIHCSGEVKRGLLTDGGWTHFAIPRGMYTDTDLTESEGLPMILQKGSAGANVTRLQELLTEAGYSLGAIDGKFGPKTEAALKRYQAEHGLVVTGTASDTLLSHIEATLEATAPMAPAGQIEAGDGAKEIRIPRDTLLPLYMLLRPYFEGSD